MNKQIIASIVFLLQVTFVSSFAAERKKKDDVKPLSKYEKLFKNKACITASGDFMTLHKVDGKLYAEMPLRLLGKEMLLSSTVSKTSDVMAGIPGYTPSSVYICFALQDSTVQIRMLSNTITANSSDPRLSRVLEEGFGNPIWMGFNVLAYNSDSTAVVFDMTKLFNTDIPELTPILREFEIYTITGKFVPSTSQLGEIKAFDNSVTIRSDLSYKVDAFYVFFPLFMGKSVDVEMVRTLILLPEKTMEPRFADARIGVFSTDKVNIPEEGGTMHPYSLAHRWRLEPKDEEAFRRGEGSEPVKPIVMYVDNHFPDNWKEPVKRGILKWNRLFERIGFKDVIQVKDFPVNDPTFDPDNIAFSCVRYVAHTKESAETVSWTDTRSGEIVHSTICLFHGMQDRILIDRFLQTSVTDPRVRSGKLIDEVWAESLEQYVTHEMGHALGLQDNMCASSAYPTDSLRSASFTSKYGISASIMDELGFNSVAQPGDVGVRLTADLGPYDELAIQWLYAPLLEAPSVAAKKEILSSWLNEKAGDPVYRYGWKSERSRYDPSCLSGDLGDDAIKAGTYALENLKVIMRHLNEWVEDDADGMLRKLFYKELCFYHESLLNNALYNVGGARINVAKEGTGVNTYEVVPREIQHASMRWMLQEFRDSEWLEDLQLAALGDFGTSPVWRVRRRSVSDPFSRENYIILLSELADSPYTLKDFANDSYQEVWKNAIQNKPLTTIDRYMQKNWLFSSEHRIRSMGGNGLSKSLASSMLAGEEPGFANDDEECVNSLVFTDREAQELGMVNVKHINNSHMYFFKVMKECEKMLEERVRDSIEADRPHYQAMLYCLRALLKEKK